MSEKLARIYGDTPDIPTTLIVECGDCTALNSLEINSKDHALAAVIALIECYNITADELPCLWVPIEQRSPKPYEIVPIASSNSLCEDLFYIKDGEWYNAHWDEPADELDIDNATHWMPIPPLPKGGEE